MAARDEEAGKIEAKIVAIEDELKAFLPGLRTMEREENKLAGHIADLDNEIEREARIPGAPGPGRPDLEAEVARGLARLETIRGELRIGRAHADDLVRSRETLRRESVAPRAAAAEILWQRDRERAAEEGTAGVERRRSAESVSDLAARYYELGRRNADERTYWERAKVLYEEFLAFPDR